MSQKKIIQLNEMEQIQLEMRKSDLEMKMKMAEKIAVFLRMPLWLGEITPRMLDLTPEMHKHLLEKVETLKNRDLKELDVEKLDECYNKFTYMDVRESLVESYIEKQEIPTRETLIVDLEHKSVFCYDDTLNFCLKLQGFVWRKLPGTKKTILTECPKRVIDRHRYFKKIQQYRDENRPIYYIEEIKNIVRKKNPNNHRSSWSLVVFTENSFFTNFTYIHPSDFEMPSFEWIYKKLIPLLVKNAVVVIEEKLNNETDVSYFPNGVNSKEEIKEWLSSRSIPYEETMCKADLMALVNKFTKEKSTLLEDIFIAKGHEVLRRQKGFPNLNVLASITNDVQKSLPEGKPNFRILLIDVLKSYTKEQWKKKFDDVKLAEIKILEEDLLLDEVIDKIIAMTAEEGLEKNCDLDDFEKDIEDYIIEKKNIRTKVIGLCGCRERSEHGHKCSQ